MHPPSTGVTKLTTCSLLVALIGGTGKLGSALAARFAGAGRPVVLGSRDAERAQRAAVEVAKRIGVETRRELTAWTMRRHRRPPMVPLRFMPGLGPPYVDVGEGSASQQTAELLPRSRVVGALRTVSSAKLANLDHDLDGDVLTTGDDSTAKAATAQLLTALADLRVVDAGPLRNSRSVEQLTVLLLSINMRVGRNTGIRIANLPDELTMPTASHTRGRAN